MTGDAFDLTGRVAIVTGGGTGIGRTTAQVLARYGADIVVASRREQNLERVAREVRDLGRTALVHRTDVRRLEECDALIDFTMEHFGKIDILVNNAGGSKAFSLDRWTANEFENSIALNLRSVFFLSQGAVRHMVPRGTGCIVNVSSLASLVPMPGLGPYGVAKSGVNNLTRLMAAEYGSDGIRVNAVAAGFVRSEGFERAMDAIGEDADEVAAAANAMGRAGRPEEIAYPILFLASNASTYLSGETIYVGGGPQRTGPW